MVNSEKNLIDETVFNNLKAGAQLPSLSWHWIHHAGSKKASSMYFKNTGDGPIIYKALLVIPTDIL